MKDYIPLVDLNAQYDSIKSEIDYSIQTILNSGEFILGEELRKFENNFADYCNSKFCIGVSSGTEALHLALRALDIGVGDEVITSANTYIATAFAISHTGAKPTLVDINPETYNIDVDLIEKNITKHTKAIIPVHLYGLPADMDTIVEYGEKYDIAIVEDASQAHGAEFKRKRVGSIGDIGCFSFYPGKNLGAYGDGGALVTNNPEIAKKISMLRDYGQKEKYDHQFIGYNSRLDNLQAAILNVKLKYLDEWNRKRIDLASQYSSLLQNANIALTENSDYLKHVYHLYVIRCFNRDKCQKLLYKHGILSGIHYPVPIHLQKAYKFLDYNYGDFPVTEKYAKHILSIPIYPDLDKNIIENISKVVIDSN